MKKSAFFNFIVFVIINSGLAMALTPAPTPEEMLVEPVAATDYAGNTGGSPFGDANAKWILSEASATESSRSVSKPPIVGNERVKSVTYVSCDGKTREKFSSLPDGVKIFDGSFDRERIVKETKADRIEFLNSVGVIPEVNLSQVVNNDFNSFKVYQTTWFDFPQKWGLCKSHFLDKQVDGVVIPATVYTENGVSAFLANLDKNTKLIGIEKPKASLKEAKRLLKKGEEGKVALPRLFINYARDKGGEVDDDLFCFARDREVVSLGAWTEKVQFYLNENGVSAFADGPIFRGKLPKAPKGTVLFDEPFVIFIVSVEDGEDVEVFKVCVVSMWYPA